MFLAILVFLWFSKKRLDNRFTRVLTKLSPYTLAVYLIHQGMINNKEFWIFGIQEKLSVPIMFHCLLTCFVIFVVCVAIDLFREQIFRIIKIDKVINAISDRLPKGLVEWQWWKVLVINLLFSFMLHPLQCGFCGLHRENPGGVWRLYKKGASRGADINQSGKRELCP